MTFDWWTKKINHQRYYKAMRRCIIINGHQKDANGYDIRGSGHAVWNRFKKQWHVIVMDLKDAEKYKHMYKHLKLEGSGGMAWGVTGKNQLLWFVADSRDPRRFMSNLPPGFHELLHALYQQEIGTHHIMYQTHGDPPEVSSKRGKLGPAATVIVHDNWYGFKTKIKMWFGISLMWVPVPMPYIPIWKAKKMYGGLS